MRVKRGIVSRRRHKKIRKLAKGMRGRRKSCFKLSKDAVERALVYAYRDRRAKKREFRSLWITRISAAARISGVSYSVFMNKLKKANITINRKMLADMAVSDPAAFNKLCSDL